MPFILGLLIALVVGGLAVGVMTWAGRFTVAPKRPSPNRERLRTLAVVRPLARAAGARTHTSLEAGPEAAPGPACPEDGSWKVITFVCHVPRLSVEERQRLLAAWGGSPHAD
jgi:hypothetical protein